MKIFITSKGNSPEFRVDPRFGRAEFYVIYDTETGEIIIRENPHKHGRMAVGISLAQIAIETGVDAAISGNFGPNAFEVLKAAGIRMFRAKKDQTVIEAVNSLLKEELEEFKKATPREVAEKFEKELK